MWDGSSPLHLLYQDYQLNGKRCSVTDLSLPVAAIAGIQDAVTTSRV